MDGRRRTGEESVRAQNSAYRPLSRDHSYRGAPAHLTTETFQFHVRCAQRAFDGPWGVLIHARRVRGPSTTPFGGILVTSREFGRFGTSHLGTWAPRPSAPRRSGTARPSRRLASVFVRAPDRACGARVADWPSLVHGAEREDSVRAAEHAVDLDRRPVRSGQDRDVAHGATPDPTRSWDRPATVTLLDRIQRHETDLSMSARGPRHEGQATAARPRTSMTPSYHPRRPSGAWPVAGVPR